MAVSTQLAEQVTEQAPPKGAADTIPGVLFEVARRLRDREYLRYYSDGEWRSLTWAEFAERARRVAAALVDFGLRPGESVALISANRVEWLYCDLGIQAAGGVTVPIYPSSVPRTVRHIVEDSEVRLAIAGSQELAAKLTLEKPLERIALVDKEVAHWTETEPSAETRAEVERRLAALEPGQVATVIYTSGTTGEPKGVVLQHRNFVQMARAALQVFDIGESDTILSFMPYSHVMERMDGIFVPSSVGARIWLARSAETLMADISLARPTIMLGAPRVFEKVYNAVYDQVRQENALKRALFRWALAAGAGSGLADRLVLAALRERLTGGRLRFFISGGAPLNEKVESFFWSLGVKILQGWGLTESTSGATSNTETAHRYRTVGRALPGMEIKLAEDGEILIKGPAVMAGYKNLPEATAQTIADGWLKTGDMGFLDGDGYLTITDRKKDLIKTSGGKYVAPLPIEAQLQADRYVRSALVLGDERPYVIALIVPDWEALTADLGLAGDPATLAGDAKVQAHFQAVVDACNHELASWETVKRFLLLPSDFSEESGELTPTFKPKRRVIMQHHEAEIEALYALPREAVG